MARGREEGAVVASPGGVGSGRATKGKIRDSLASGAVGVYTEGFLGTCCVLVTSQEPSWRCWMAY